MGSVKIKDVNRIPDLLKTLDKISRTRVEVGVFGSDNSFIAMIASVHEFGLTINPKGQYLAIPVHKDAEGKSPREFGEELTFYSSHRGKGGVLVRKFKNRGKDTKGDELMYVLVRQVKIPERSFIRSTFDEKERDWFRFVARMFKQVLVGKMTVDIMFERLGQRMVADIQKKMRNMEPGNAPLTNRIKKSSKPLINTGRLRQSVTYKVVND